MARLTLSLTAGSTVIGAEHFSSPATDIDPVNAATTTADSATVTTADTLALTTNKATVDTAIGVLVTDAASPTQAHVTTLNTAWTTMKTNMAALHTAIAALQADLAGAPVSRDLVVSFDKAKISSISSLRAALNRVLDAAASTGLTP